jgi:DNA-binding IclR family transcriptional regulator
MAVLRLFTPHRTELSMMEAADLLDAPKSSVSRWMRAMEEEGFLVRDPESGRYRLSMELAALGEVARRSTSMQRMARPILAYLVAETGETSNLVTRDGRVAVNVEVVQSPQPVTHVGVLGRRLPLHATAAGKVLLAWLPEEQLTPLLDDPLPRFTPGTLPTRARLTAELARVRKKGYATAWQEWEPDLAAASAPVRDHRGEVVAAITSSLPVSRSTPGGLTALGERVRGAADALSEALGYRERPSREATRT